jgi:Sodium:sulfate symporter transmembrane region
VDGADQNEEKRSCGKEKHAGGKHRTRQAQIERENDDTDRYQADRYQMSPPELISAKDRDEVEDEYPSPKYFPEVKTGVTVREIKNAAGHTPIYYGSGYIDGKDWWVLGFICGAIYFGIFLLVGVPWNLTRI